MNANTTLRLPKIIGHRAAGAYAPENTVAALKTANNLKAKWIEFDVMLTQDHIPIVFHDDTLARTTNGTGLVAHTQYQDLCSLDAGSWFSPKFVDEKIPTLVDYLRLASDYHLGINLEIKPSLGKEIETAEKVVERLHQHWPMQDGSLLISSFSIPALQRVRELDKRVPLGLLLEKLDAVDWQTITHQLSCYSLNIHHTLLTTEIIKAIKCKVDYLLAFTVNDKDRAFTLFEMGVDSIFSDHPDLLLHCPMHAPYH